MTAIGTFMPTGLLDDVEEGSIAWSNGQRTTFSDMTLSGESGQASKCSIIDGSSRGK